MATATPRSDPTKRTAPRFFQIVPPGKSFEFVRHFKLCAALSLGVLLVAALAIPVRGIRLGVDFAGGYHIVARVAAQPPASEGDVRAALSQTAFADADVVREGRVGDGVFQIRLPAMAGRDPAEAAQVVREALAAGAGATSVAIEKVDFVGPRVGTELRGQALKSLAIAFLLIFGYVALRFAPSYAPGAVIALLHDVGITAGLFVLFGWEFDMSVLAALLTIIGYSINDTIVIFDRIRELRAQRTNVHPSALVNLAINDTLSRTLLTSGTTLLAVFALLLFGGPVLRGFSVAMALGIVVGTYSTVYVAAPILLWIEAFGVGRGAPPRASQPASPSGRLDVSGAGGSAS